MKKITVQLKNGKEETVIIPENCTHPKIYPPLNCMALHSDDMDCNCRWCTFNKEYAKANETHRS